MGPEFRQSYSGSQTQRQSQKLAAAARQTKRQEQLLVDEDLLGLHEEDERPEDNDDQEPLPEEESAGEPQQVEESGDSIAALEGEKASPFDFEWQGTLPTIHGVPRRANVLVRYSIGKDYRVCRLADWGNSELTKFRDAVAKAIAIHLRNHETLNETKDWSNPEWCNVPAIARESLTALFEEVNETEDDTNKLSRGALKERLNHLTTLKEFAILLPNGDVIVPGILFHAVKGKRATRAAILRKGRGNPSRFLPEKWLFLKEEYSAKDWRKFKRAASQRKKRKTRSKKSSPQG